MTVLEEGANKARTTDWSCYAVESEGDKLVDVAHAVGEAVLYLFKICSHFLQFELGTFGIGGVTSQGDVASNGGVFIVTHCQAVNYSFPHALNHIVDILLVAWQSRLV